MKKYIAIFLCTILLLFYLPVVDSDNSECTSIQLSSVEFKVYSNSDRLPEIVSPIGDVAQYTCESPGSVFIFDYSWIDDNSSKTISDTILNSLNSHFPTIIINCDKYEQIRVINKVSGITQNEQIHCGFMDYNGITYEYSIGSEYSEFEALELAYRWVIYVMETYMHTFDEVELNDNVNIEQLESSSNENTPYWSLIGVISYSEKLFSDRGSFALTIEVSQLMNFDYNDKDYFQLHYFLYGTANESGGYRLSEISLSYSLPYGTNLYGHGPTNTAGSSNSTVSVDIGGGGSSSGFDLSGIISASWSYTIPDVVVNNKSEIVNNIVDITHDIDENKNVGKAYCAEPGVLLSIDREIDSSYVSYTHMENYYIRTCHHKDSFFGYINNNSEYQVHWLPYYVTVYNGHTDGSYATWN